MEEEKYEITWDKIQVMEVYSLSRKASSRKIYHYYTVRY